MDVPLKKKTYYPQKYRSEWEHQEKFKGWLKPVISDISKAYCSICHIQILAKLTDINKHANTKKHKNNFEIISKNRQIFYVPVKNQEVESKKAELKLSLFIVEHTSINQVDHLTDLCKEVFGDSKSVQGLKLHRTKCTQIINNTLAPHFRSELLKDIGSQKYSIIIDESTDITTTKYMGIVIRYFSLTRKQIISAFLALESIEKANADGLVACIIKCLQSNNLPLTNLIGIGTDNAAVMTGRQNSVFQLLKSRCNLPNLILIRCVCHSLQLAVSHASTNTIPCNIDFLIRETYKWFCMSTKRQVEYKEIYQTINCGEGPLKILKVCDTRWLSIEPVIVRILAQWEELKLHFMTTQDQCHTAKLLSNMYCDEANRLYLFYLRSVLSEVQSTIKIFEGENVDPVKLITSLMTLLRSVCSKILIPNAAVTDRDYLRIQIEDRINPVPYLGYIFELHVSKTNLSKEVITAVRNNCIQFTIKLAKELQNRLPGNYIALEKIVQLSEENTLKQIKDNSISELAIELSFSEEKIEKILHQWHNIQFIKWDKTGDTVKFWSQVYEYKNAAEINSFQDIADLAITALSLPHSNAEVERIFSTMNLVKNKMRNRLISTTLNSIILIRNQLKISKKNCHTYVIPEEILTNIPKTIKTSAELEPSPSTSTATEICEIEDDTIDDSIFQLLEM